MEHGRRLLENGHDLHRLGRAFRRHSGNTHPRLKIILGHLGETLPFLVWRVDHALSRPGHKAISFRDVFCNNFYITTSGNFSDPALLCCVMEMGVDHILLRPRDTPPCAPLSSAKLLASSMAACC